MIRMPPRPGKALEEAVSLWLEVGSLAPLEHAVFAGYGQLLEGRTSRIPKVNAFLKKVPQYQGRIARVHEAASNGDLTKLALLLDRPEWAVSRDDTGSTALQKAMLANHLSVVRFLLHKSPRSLTATDRMGRTPLHYAAALDAVNQGSGGSNGVCWYQVLTDYGANEDTEDLDNACAYIVDVSKLNWPVPNESAELPLCAAVAELGRTPNFYKEYCEELLLKEAETAEAPESRTPSPSDDDMVNDLVFHVTVEIKQDDDRDSQIAYEI